MVTLTEAARQAVTAFFAENPGLSRTLRLYVAPGTCGGPVLNMTVDEVDASDVTEVVDDVTFCIDRQLQQRVGAIVIDVNGEDVLIRAERPLMDPSAFAGCSCCSGSCNCICGGYGWR